MTVQFAESGAQYHFNNSGGPGVWGGGGQPATTAAAPAGRSSTFAYTNNGNNATTPAYANFGTIISGYAVYINALGSNATIIGYFNAGAAQCDVRKNTSDNLVFTRNGTVIGGTSTRALTIGWHYIEFKAIFSTAGAGTCEVVVDGVTWLTSTSLTNATTVNTANQTQFSVTTVCLYARDFYVLDTGTGTNTTYLGDITVAEIFPTAPGTNSAWATGSGVGPPPTATGPFTLTSVNTSGVYQGTITGGASNAYVGYKFDVTGFVNGANNQTGAVCTASTATAITLGGVTISETHAGSAAFENPVQIGIAGTGTRPNGDGLYVYDSVANDLSDWAHQALVLTGTIACVLHRTYARKDDAGARSIAQITVQSGSVTETSATIALTSSYVYYTDILEQNPTGPATWTTTTFNAATFGVKEVT